MEGYALPCIKNNDNLYTMYNPTNMDNTFIKLNDKGVVKYVKQNYRRI